MSDLCEIGVEEIVEDQPSATTSSSSHLPVHDVQTNQQMCSQCKKACTPEPSTSDAGVQASYGLFHFAHEHIFDKRRFHFCTGLEDYDLFKLIFDWLGETVNELTYYYGFQPSLTPEDQFYLTLFKLRSARSNYDLSGVFKIPEKEVTNIFVTWINFLYHEFTELNMWPSRDLVQFYSPSDFKKKYPSTRVVIDGTEIPLKRPKQPSLQQATYSTYKNRNTVKVLIGISPAGLVTYISTAYGGSASDKQICERSELMNMCDPYDSIMSDKGFNVQDLFAPSMVKVNIPEFFRKKNRMSGKSVLQDRRIARKRVHVERVIGLAKTFKILSLPLDNTLSELADHIITVAFSLCIFKCSIVHVDA